MRFHDGNTDGDYDGGTQEGDNTLYYGNLGKPGEFG